ANLCGADLDGADLDFSSLPLWCGGLSFRIDERLAKQLMYHTLQIMDYSGIDIPQNIEELQAFANGFHQAQSGSVKKLEICENKED
ncbi:MAG: hypothetical protein DRQ46_00360, partial [Gammaproteobacteria bacterium]